MPHRRHSSSPHAIIASLRPARPSRPGVEWGGAKSSVSCRPLVVGKQAGGRAWPCRPCHPHRPGSHLMAGIAIRRGVVIRAVWQASRQRGDVIHVVHVVRVLISWRAWRALRYGGASSSMSWCKQAGKLGGGGVVLPPSRLGVSWGRLVSSRPGGPCVGEYGGAYSIVIRTVISQASRRRRSRVSPRRPVFARLPNISSIYGYRRVLIIPGFPLPCPR